MRGWDTKDRQLSALCFRKSCKNCKGRTCIHDCHKKELYEIFKSTGECKHPDRFKEPVIPYGTNVKLIQCGICNKVLEKIYLE